MTLRLELLENGIDSLRFGMEFYDEYLKLEDKYDSSLNPGYLKMAVISFHNALELFSKKLLSNENELLIYRDLSDPVLLELLKHKKNTERDIPLDYYVISDQVNILTIDYTECIKRLGIIFNLPKSQINTLNSMGKIRNKITHFGLDKTIDFHEILSVINDALDLITAFYFENLQSVNKKHPLDSICEEIIDLVKVAREEEIDSWEVYYADNFEDINIIFDSLNEDEQFNSELLQKGYMYEVELGSYSHSANLTIKLIKQNGDLHISIRSINLPKLNATIFINDLDGSIYFIIDQSKKLLEEEKDCYVYKKPENNSRINMEEGRFWERDSQNKVGKCYGINFNLTQLKRIIKELI